MFSQEVRSAIPSISQLPDTLLSHLTDSLRVLLVEQGITIRDSLAVIARQAGTDWAAILTFVSTLGFIGVTFYWGKKSHSVSAEMRDLQDEFNKREGERDEHRREATDARLSAIAYALARQLQSWLTDIPPLTTTLTDSRIVEEQRVHGWIFRRQGHFNEAERRMEQLLEHAPDGSEHVAQAIRLAYVTFFQATGRLNDQERRFKKAGLDESELKAAVSELEECIGELNAVIGPELQRARELAGLDAFIVVPRSKVGGSG